MNVQVVQPQMVTSDRLVNQNTLIIRAPALLLPSEFSSESSHNFGQDLAKTDDSSVQDIILLSEFDQSWLRASTEEQESFIRQLSEKNSVALSTIPHALDWIWESMSVEFRERLADELDEVLVVSYPKKDESAVTSAVERCVDLANDSATGSSALTENTIRDNLDILTYEHSFQNRDLSDRIGTYGPTIVPNLVTTISTSSWRSGLSMAGVKRACRDIAEGFTLRKFFVDTTESIQKTTDSIPTELPEKGLKSTAELATTIGVDALPWGGTASLLVWGIIRDEDDISGEGIIEQLAELNLLPTARASLETETGLPPRTLDLIAGSNSDVFISEIRTLISDEEVSEDLLSIQNEEYSSEISTLESVVERLDDEMASLIELYSEHLDSAVHSIDIIDQQIVSDETRLLGTLVDDGSLTADDIPYIDSVRDDVSPTRIMEINEAVREGGIVILNGPRGTGKTSSVYNSGRRLEQEGYSLTIPNLQEHSAGFIEQAISETTENRQVLYTSLEIGPRRTRASRQDIATLINWLGRGVCHTVIIECRSEMSQILQSQLNDLTVRNSAPETTEIGFTPLENPEELQEIIDWVIKNSDTGAIDTATQNEILSLADGNPEICKLATRFAISDRKSLAELSTARELVLSDLQSLFNRSSHPRELYERAIVLLAVSGGLSTDQLAAALDISRTDLWAKLTDVSGYLSDPVRTQLEDQPGVGSEDAQWELSPDVYADATLQRCVLQQGNYDFWWAFDTLFTEQHSEVDFSFKLWYVARRLGVNFAATKTRGDGELRKAIQETAHQTINRVNEDYGAVHLQKVLRLIIEQGVPVSPDFLVDNPYKIVQGLNKADRDVVLGSPVAVLHRNLGYLLAAHVNRDQNPEEVIEASNQLAEWSYQWYDYNPNRFLSNVYRLGIPVLFEMNSGNPDDSRLSQMNSLISTSAHSTEIPEAFLANIYAASLGAVDFSTKYDGDFPWTDYVNNCIRKAALSSQNNTEPMEFVSETYGLAIHKYAYSSKTPTEWLSSMFDLIEESVKRNSDLYTPASDLFPMVYRTAISEMVKNKKRNISTEWPAAMLQQIDQTTTASWLEDDPDEFRQKVIASVVVGATSADPRQIGGWSSDVVDMCLRQLSTSNVSHLYRLVLETLATEELDVKIAWIVADSFERLDPTADQDQLPELCLETVIPVAAAALRRVITIKKRYTNSDYKYPKIRYLNHQIAEQVGKGLMANIPEKQIPEAVSELSTMVGAELSEESNRSVSTQDRIESELITTIYIMRMGLISRDSEITRDLLEEALKVAETTSDSCQTTWLLMKHVIVGVGVSWSRKSPPEYFRMSLESIKAHDRIPYDKFARDTIKRVCSEAGADSKCANHVAKDAIEYWTTEHQCRGDWFENIGSVEILFFRYIFT